MLQFIFEETDLALILVFSNRFNINKLILDFGEAAYLIFQVVYLLPQIFDLLHQFSIFDFLQRDDLLHFTLVARCFHHFLPLSGQFLPASDKIGLQTDLLLHEVFHQIAALLYLFIQFAALLFIMQDFLVKHVVFKANFFIFSIFFLRICLDTLVNLPNFAEMAGLFYLALLLQKDDGLVAFQQFLFIPFFSLAITMHI
jgi:hypothetical protein